MTDIENIIINRIDNALESAGYIKRGKNYPKVYATSILAKTMVEASETIEKSSRFDESQKLNARRILSYLISSKNRASSEDEAESRIDWIADKLGFEKEKVVETINLLREEGLLSDHQDLTAYIKRVERKNKTANILN
jgi:ATP-dependent DNA helicase RecQ